MKWIFTFFLVTILLSGCTHSVENIKPPENFELSGRLRYEGIESQVKLHRNGRTILEFESPSGLRGLTISLDHSFMELEYEGMTKQFTVGSLQEFSPLGIIISVLDEDTNNMYLDNEGNIIKISVPEQNLDLEIQRFQKLEQNS